MKTKPMVLCPLSEWYETTFTKGKLKGKTVRRRDVLVFVKWDLFWGKETENSDKIDACAHYGSMFTFLPTLKHIVKDKEFAVNQIIGALCSRTNKSPSFTKSDPYNDLESLGKWIDDEFGTSYLRRPQPPLVYYKIFAKELGIDDVSKIAITEDE